MRILWFLPVSKNRDVQIAIKFRFGIVFSSYQTENLTVDPFHLEKNVLEVVWTSRVKSFSLHLEQDTTGSKFEQNKSNMDIFTDDSTKHKS